MGMKKLVAALSLAIVIGIGNLARLFLWRMEQTKSLFQS